jgi:beta-galactosidase
VTGNEIFQNGFEAGAGTTSPPSDQTVTIGRTAQFSVTTTAPDPTYQWQRNGVVIAGANAATYTTPPATAADDGARFNVVVASGSGTAPSASAVLTVDSAPAYVNYPGFIGTDLNNDTRGAWQDSQIYVTVLGNDPATGALSHVGADGTLTPCSVADNTAADAVTAPNGHTYPNYAFTLAQSNVLKLPPVSSGRIFVSLGSPLYMSIVGGANGNIGYAGPNPLNATDPNIDIHYDWYEFTYGANGGIYINTTQVDQFGLPLMLDVWGAGETFHRQTGITESVASIDAEFANETPAIFHATPVSSLRIFSPANSTFNTGQANDTYFDGYVDEVWTYYATHTLTALLYGGSREFVGNTQGAQFVFTEVNLGNGAYVGGTYAIQSKPTTQDILYCRGPLATGNSVEGALEAQFCAAFNRHVMEDYTAWTQPSDYYQAAPANYYAQFWHRHSVAGLAYGFAYDDVNNQSSTIVSPTPEHMALGVGY